MWFYELRKYIFFLPSRSELRVQGSELYIVLRLQQQTTTTTLSIHFWAVTSRYFFSLFLTRSIAFDYTKGDYVEK